MGLTRAKITVSNPLRPELKEDVELTVNTGSVFAWIPKATLKRLDISPLRKRAFKTIEGREIERDVGVATLRYDKSETTIEVVFAEEGDVPVLGAIALEALGYRVNPVTGELEYVGLLAA